MSSTSQRVQSRQACSQLQDAARATREVADAIGASTADINFLFVSSTRDLDAVARSWREASAGPTLCCTTAGEIWRGGGHVKGAIAGASLSGVRSQVWPIHDLCGFDAAQAQELRARMCQFLDSVHDGESVAAIILLDGMSRSEERVVAYIQEVLGGVPMVGGSAGDDLTFTATHVLADGRFVSNAGSIALVATTAAITTFAGHHFEPTGKQVVVTAADPAIRRVRELDGLPAAETYRRLTGLPVDPLSPSAMAVSPLMLTIGGESYIRSLAGESDGALDLYCAIDEGLVLDIGRSTDLRARLEEVLQGIYRRVNKPELVLGFDCVLRRLEMDLFGDTAMVADILSSVPFFGFSTYGEVTRGMHVNQTLTGIAFGNNE